MTSSHLVTIIGCIWCMLQSVEHHCMEIETVMSGSYCLDQNQSFNRENIMLNTCAIEIVIIGKRRCDSNLQLIISMLWICVCKTQVALLKLGISMVQKNNRKCHPTQCVPKKYLKSISLKLYEHLLLELNDSTQRTIILSNVKNTKQTLNLWLIQLSLKHTDAIVYRNKGLKKEILTIFYFLRNIKLSTTSA